MDRIPGQDIASLYTKINHLSGRRRQEQLGPVRESLPHPEVGPKCPSVPRPKRRRVSVPAPADPFLSPPPWSQQGGEGKVRSSFRCPGLCVSPAPGGAAGSCPPAPARSRAERAAGPVPQPRVPPSGGEGALKGHHGSDQYAEHPVPGPAARRGLGALGRPAPQHAGEAALQHFGQAGEGAVLALRLPLALLLLRLQPGLLGGHQPGLGGPRLVQAAAPPLPAGFARGRRQRNAPRRPPTGPGPAAVLRLHGLRGVATGRGAGGGSGGRRRGLAGPLLPRAGLRPQPPLLALLQPGREVELPGAAHDQRELQAPVQPQAAALQAGVVHLPHRQRHDALRLLLRLHAGRGRGRPGSLVHRPGNRAGAARLARAPAGESGGAAPAWVFPPPRPAAAVPPPPRTSRPD
ncbi:Krueppel-like factor 5 [Platysternon megacephalum]|uniref:Krueppel-like factor 5 n=1 Tax=Platysternon megacephalum TaxID=55544 RepID=A0A4D9DXN0_9SAUR|nr:Krueppel-like factor 5 [Platysternon megacephalum]